MAGWLEVGAFVGRCEGLPVGRRWQVLPNRAETHFAVVVGAKLLESKIMAVGEGLEGPLVGEGGSEGLTVGDLVVGEFDGEIVGPIVGDGDGGVAAGRRVGNGEGGGVPASPVGSNGCSNTTFMATLRKTSASLALTVSGVYLVS